MTDFEYLSVEQIIEINADQGGYPLDTGGIEGAAWRPQSGGFGVEKFPDIWSKAAAYVHGFASPQYFSDGNKRTGWFAATSFLAGNGYRLPQMPAIEAEVFVQGVAQNVFDTDGDREKTIKKAAEWFQSKWDNERRGVALDPHLEYAFLAGRFRYHGDGTGDVFQFALHTVTVSTEDGSDPFPGGPPILVIGRWHWDAGDNTVSHLLRATMVPDEGSKRINRPIVESRVEPFEGAPSAHIHHSRPGLRPMIFWLELKPVFLEPCRGTVVLEFDERVIAELRFEVQQVPDFSTVLDVPTL